VLEHGEEIVGFLGNLPVLARFDGQPLWGATGTSFLVEVAHRAHSVRLMRAFAAQAGAAFSYSATANPHSAPVYKGFRYQAIGGEQGGLRLRWWADGSAAVQSLAARAGVPAFGKAAGWIGSLTAHVRRQLRVSHQGDRTLANLRVERLRAQDLALPRASHWPQTWDVFANALASRPGLHVDRSAATFAWRLSDPDLADDLALWALRDSSGRMLGLCMARKIETLQGGAAPRAELMDLAVLPQAPAASIDVLLEAALQWARSWRLACLDAKRWTGPLAERLALLAHRKDALPPDGLWLLVNPVLGRQAVPASLQWGMTGIDSDDWYCSHRRDIDVAASCELRPEQRGWQALVQASKDADKASQSCSAVSTSDGSNRSMSTA
jgi:GNAT superfamily N-acetyltransferase